MSASLNGHVQVVKLLLKKHADVNIRSKVGWTALLLASENGFHEVVELLLKEDADMNVQVDNFTPLIFASINGYYEVVELLINKKASFDHKALIGACQNGYYHVAEILLKEHAADVNVCNQDGWTALMYASEDGCNQVVQLLLDYDADVNIQTHDGWTALMCACRFGHHRTVQLILKKCLNINARANGGITALMVAIQNEHYPVVEVLLEARADTSIHNDSGLTALMLACLNNHIKIAKLLIKKHTNVSDKWFSLTLAKYYGRNEITELLLTELNQYKTISDSILTFKTTHNEFAIESEIEQDQNISDQSIQLPKTEESFLTSCLFDIQEKKTLLANLQFTADKYQVTGDRQAFSRFTSTTSS
jgi:serine/threonine-protein phosphatase 6 regulatory ankyrin repeat subunit B